MSLKGACVLVTGAGGFIGSHLTERLVGSGATVRAFVHYRGNGSWGWLDESECRNDVEVVTGDVSDRDSVMAAMKGTDIVFHLAALVGIPYSYHAAASYVRTNIEGTLNVLQAGREVGVSRIVHTSTSEVYGTAKYVPIDESHPLEGQSPYSATKIGADKLAQAFHLSFGLPVVTIRPFNTFGPRQSSRAVVPTIVSQCLSSSIVRMGSLHPTRDLNYVENTVDAYLACAEAEGVIGQTINVGSGSEISMGDLAARIARILSKTVKIEIEDDRVRPPASEVDRLLADNSRARTVLGWQPAVTLDEGLSRTSVWIEQHQALYRAERYNI